MALFLSLQITLVAGFACHRLLLAIWSKLSRESSSQQVKFLSQCLFAATLLMALGFPTKIQRQVLPLPVQKPILDSMGNIEEVMNSPVTRAKVSVSPKAVARPSNLSVTPSFLLKCVIGLGFLIGLFQVIRNFLFLTTVLNESYVIRQYKRTRIALSPSITVPFSVWFFFKKWVVLPESFLSDREKYSISLKHELEHHRAKDTHWAFALECLTPFFFLNPFYFFWKNSLLELQEFSCDESLIGRKKLSPRKYGDCLLQVAEAALRSRPLLKGVAGMAQTNPLSQTSLERRIRMLTRYKKNRPISVLLSVLAVFSLFIMSAFTLSIKSLAQVSDSNPTPGVAKVDPKAQAIAEKYVEKAYNEFFANSVFAIVSEASTGRVLAVANIDSDPGKPHSPHWALSVRVEPASVIKAVVAAAAIEEGKTEPNEVHNCENGKLIIGGKQYTDWKAFDKLTTAEAIAMSSNVCGIKIGRKLGAERINESLKHYGFGTGELTSRFPEARAGVLPSLEGGDKEQYFAQSSVGYGYFVTPLELVQVFGAMANGGNLFAPVQADEKVNPKPLRRIFSASTSHKMREILASVMTQGTARRSQGKKFQLAGKTGTAQSPWLVSQGSPAKDSQVAHFIGFGPVENPKYVVYVAVQDPKDKPDHKAHGSDHAAPVFRNIIEALLE